MKYDVCVFGPCSLDETYFEKVDGTFNGKPDMSAPGGKAANQAVAAARAGAKTVIITKVGNDPTGRTIVDNLALNSVDTDHVEFVDGLENDYAKIKIRLNDKENIIERFQGATNSFSKDLIEKNKDVILNSSIILAQTKIDKEVTKELINFCYNNNKPIILNPSKPENMKFKEDENKELLAKVAMIVCNRQECASIFETDDLKKCTKAYPNKLIVTLGDEGLIYFNGERIVHMRAIPTNVVDTTGAGDTLIGNVAASLLKGSDIDHSLRKSMYAAAFKLGYETAQKGMPLESDLEIFIANKRSAEFQYKEELTFAMDVVRSAYDAVKYNSTFQIHSKDDNTLVTDADIAIEKYMLNRISEKYPNDNFISEEHNPNNELRDRTWVIDPIDGTVHFVKQDGYWGIQLAFYDKQDTRFSIIYLPTKDEMYYAVENNGVYINNNKILDIKVSPLNHSIVEFGGSFYDKIDVKKACLSNLIREDKESISSILHLNSVCHSYTNLITGKSDALIISSKKVWDVMPGEFMCRVLNLPVVYLDTEKETKLITKNETIKYMIVPYR